MARFSRLLATVVFASMSLTGACADPVSPPDAGARDASSPDTGVADADTPDVEVPDAGPLDTGHTDSAPVDSGPLDSGAPDAGPADSGALVIDIPGPVTGLYPLQGRDWNDYVVNDGPTPHTGSDTACTGTEASDHTGCLHAGELRAVAIPGRSSCAGLTLEDALGALQWRCDDSTGTARAFSFGFAPGRRLSDLIDAQATPPVWRANQVLVSDGVASGASPLAAWWSNPIQVAHQGGSLDVSGTIYVATSTPAAAYSIDADAVALVVQRGLPSQVTAIGRRFLWVEGDMRGGSSSLHFDSVLFSTLRGVRAQQAQGSGILLEGSSHNRLIDIESVANGAHGISITQGVGNLLSGIRVSRNSRNGLHLSAARYASIFDVTTSNNGGTGLHVTFGNGTRATNVLATGNASVGIGFYQSSRSTLFNAVAANTASDANLHFARGGNHTLMNIVATNGGSNGVRFGQDFASEASSLNRIINAAVVHNRQRGLLLVYSSRNLFTGRLEVGDNNGVDCWVGLGTNPGLADQTCVSAASLSTNVSLQSAFAGLLQIDDPVNGSDMMGYAANPAFEDLTAFAYPTRAWVRESPPPFPGPGHTGRCSGGCRIADFATSAADTGIAGSPALRGVLADPDDADPVPDGDDFAYQLWAMSSADDCALVPGAEWEPQVCTVPGITTEEVCQQAQGIWSVGLCASPFLLHAYERMHDGEGNENTLCESNETCIFTPNIGRDQGFGALVDTGPFAPGALTNIRLLRYAQQR